MHAASDAGNWLRLDEIENAFDNLRMCAEFLEPLDNPIRWKWAILALHQALYGFAICATYGTNCASVLSDPNKPGESHLINIREALKRAKSREHLWPSALPLVTTPDEDAAIHRLVDEFRNGFEHFRPMAWSIEVSGMPGLFQLALRVLCFIALESRSVRYESDVQEDRVRRALGRLDQILAPYPSTAG